MSHEHSQLPWRHDPENPGLVLAHETDEDGRAVTVSDSVDPDDAEFIVHACNSHDDLFRQATKAAKIAERYHAALEHIRDNFDHEHHSKGQVAKGECDGAPQCRACEAAEALESKEPQQRRRRTAIGPSVQEFKAAKPRAPDGHTLAPADGLATSHCEANAASHEVSQRPAAFSDNGSRGNFPAEGEPATPVRVGKNKTAGSPDSRKRNG